jgi:hypothetical protein
MHRILCPATPRNIPPSGDVFLLRWFDRTRWKFGDAGWFASAEAALAQGLADTAYRIALAGVRAELASAWSSVPAAAAVEPGGEDRGVPAAEPMPGPAFDAHVSTPAGKITSEPQVDREPGPAPSVTLPRAPAWSPRRIVDWGLRALGLFVVAGIAIAQLSAIVETRLPSAPGWSGLAVAGALILLIAAAVRSARSDSGRRSVPER